MKLAGFVILMLAALDQAAATGYCFGEFPGEVSR